MSDSKPQAEPSMEEILASIRRIISEDGKAADGAPAAATRETPPPREAEPEPEDDVLELTEALPDDEPPAPEPEPPPPPRVEAPPPPPEPEPPAVEEIEIVDTPEAPAVADIEPPPAPVLATDRGGLVSDAASGASAASLASLASRMAQMHAGFPLGQGNRTIEDLVKEVMRPMIKEWLDAHLPAMVERLVRREIDRIARRIDDD